MPPSARHRQDTSPTRRLLRPARRRPGHFLQDEKNGGTGCALPGDSRCGGAASRAAEYQARKAGSDEAANPGRVLFLVYFVVFSYRLAGEVSLHIF